MPHTIREKTKLLNRVQRIRGQIEAVERSLEEERGCAEVTIVGASTTIDLPSYLALNSGRASPLDPAANFMTLAPPNWRPRYRRWTGR